LFLSKFKKFFGTLATVDCDIVAQQNKLR